MRGVAAGVGEVEREHPTAGKAVFEGGGDVERIARGGASVEVGAGAVAADLKGFARRRLPQRTYEGVRDGVRGIFRG